jgi:ectoine hydroxylase-related dioxygenase (phytanoyl-CoA dioxygenase family)
MLECVQEVWLEQIAKGGFAILPEVFRNDEMATLLEAFTESNLPRTKAGIRHALNFGPVDAIAHDPRLLTVVRSVLGENAIPFSATLFDKSPDANWLVVWHQDTALPLRHKKELAGWGPWSEKQGVIYAHAPASALEGILALRIHLDHSTSQNGPLRVLPGTHTLGVLSDDSIDATASKCRPSHCEVPRGGVLAMKPLLVHSSSKSRDDHPRRVLHIEYASSNFMADGLELVRA